MTKAVLFDFDETLQDRTAAFEKYMDTFQMLNFCPIYQKKKRIKEKKIWLIPATAGM